MTNKDRLAAHKALIRWFESQGLPPHEAIPIMGVTIVDAICAAAEPHDADPEEGLEAFIHGLRGNMKAVLR